MKNITSKEDIKLFRREIKKELKNILSNVEDNLDEVYGLELLNEDDKHICHILVRAGMTTPDLRRIEDDSIIIADTLHSKDFNLNKHTTDYQLKKVVNQIIDKYNEIVDDEIEYRKASEKNQKNKDMKKKIKKLYCTDFNVFTEIYPNDGYKALNAPSSVYEKYSLDKNKVIEAAKQIMDEFGIAGNPEDHVDYWETCRDEKLFLDEDGTVIMECYDECGECYKRYKFRHCL